MNRSVKELIQRLKEPDYEYYGCELSKCEAELAISALEKQIPSKPQEVDVDFSIFECPNCSSTIRYTGDKHAHNYCSKCAQKLDWSVEE